jgi:DNA repair protein RadC
MKMKSIRSDEKVKEASYYHTRIRDWPESERPREKLMKHGPAALSDAELLAILIGSGTTKVTAVDLAKRLLVEHKNLRELAGMSVADLKKYKGIGCARAVSVVSAFELGRRLHTREDEQLAVVRSPEDVAARYIPKLRDLKKEVFLLLLLNSANRIIKEVKISEGSLNASVVHPREVFKAAIDELAAGVILIHNHPSGNPTPSSEDIALTKQILEAGKVVGISVHDHIIVAGGNYTSLAEENLL